MAGILGQGRGNDHAGFVDGKRLGWKGFMTYMRGIRVIAGLTGVLVAASVLGGCVSSPTYGTGTSAAEQLLDDIGSAATIGGAKKKNIKYTPRPGLVVPSAEEQASLIEPQASLANRDNGQWAESPEEMRIRLAQEAEENRNNPRYTSPLAKGPGFGTRPTDQQFAAFRKAKQDQAGNYEGRRYLTDPPVGYRKADPAALTDLGESEVAKEKRRRKAATLANTGSKWWMPFQ